MGMMGASLNPGMGMAMNKVPGMMMGVGSQSSFMSKAGAHPVRKFLPLISIL
jgi:hypothetical protein